MRKAFTKGCLCVVTTTLLIANAVFAFNVDLTIQKTLELLSADYSKVYPLGGMKKGLAVLTFAEESPKAKEKGLGNTLREIVSSRMANSSLFYLIDRDTLDASMREQKLVLAGVIDEASAVKAGSLLGVQVFLTGSISEIQDKFTITLKLIEAETGKVIASQTVEVYQKELYTKQDEIAFAYISEYGIGLNYQASLIQFLIKPASDKTVFAASMHDIYLNYRPFLWLNTKIGISYMPFSTTIPTESRNLTLSTVYPQVTKYSNQTVPSAVGKTISYEGGKGDWYAPYLGVDYNWTPVPYFNLGVGLGMNVFINPVFTQEYSPGFALQYEKISSNYTITNMAGDVENGRLYIEQKLKALFLLRFEIKPQYFISPRVTVGAYFSIVGLGSVFTPQSTRLNDSFAMYGDDEFYTNTGSTRFTKYMGISRTLVGDGLDITKLSFMGSVMFGLSLNFYF